MLLELRAVVAEREVRRGGVQEGNIGRAGRVRVDRSPIFAISRGLDNAV